MTKDLVLMKLQSIWVPLLIPVFMLTDWLCAPCESESDWERFPARGGDVIPLKQPPPWRVS
jgi:hypothetical protein